jgi:hypothetical protein
MEEKVQKKRTRPRIQIDLDKVEQLAQVCDNEEEIALALGISYRTLQNRKKDFANFATAIKKGKAKANAFVGGKLMSLIKEGNPAAIIFYMKSRCGWRETVKQEITGADGGAVKIETKQEYDLSKLSVSQLEALETILNDSDTSKSGGNKTLESS